MLNVLETPHGPGWSGVAGSGVRLSELKSRPRPAVGVASGQLTTPRGGATPGVGEKAGPAGLPGPDPARAASGLGVR